MANNPHRERRLHDAADIPADSAVVPLLKTKLIGKPYLYLESVDSTSTYLASVPSHEAVHGTVVAAGEQTAGRGRMKRRWFSPPGTNLYFSLLLRPDITPAKAPQLALISAAALLNVLKNLFPGLHPTVKWPNDILLQGRKLAGILCEMQTKGNILNRVIVGIGLNVNSRCQRYEGRLRDTAISLLDATERTSNRITLIADILMEFERCYEIWMETGLQQFIAFIDENSAIRDREITVIMQEREITGIARGLTDDGHLRLETPDSTLLLPSGEVYLKDIYDVQKRHS